MKFNNRDDIIQLTALWEGERFDDGRPGFRMISFAGWSMWLPKRRGQFCGETITTFNLKVIGPDYTRIESWLAGQ